ncbi:MAG: TonB-dependent receptor plug domain-containing protein [Chitinophagaceae bacterium]|nr:TonB-dependent receptor plug domain-containing protein [Chitinophagaceae bacterium]
MEKWYALIWWLCRQFQHLTGTATDLKQIEIIKGASSTLYGGGAIAGMINIISKKPKNGIRERYLLLNQST